MNKLAALTLLALPLASPARAVTIDPDPTLPAFNASGFVDAATSTNDPRTNERGFHEFSGGGLQTEGTSQGSAEATIDLSHAPNMSSHGRAGVHPQGATYGESEAALYYDFEIVGPSTTDVSVYIKGSGGVSASGPEARATALFSINGNGGYVVNDSIEARGESDAGALPPYDTHTGAFSVDQHFLLSSNTEYVVSLSTYAFAGSGGILAGISDAASFVDPYFAVDSGNSDYHLVFSNGINNSLGSSIPSAVPLPASAPMLGASLLALGVAGYGMKRKKGAAV